MATHRFTHRAMACEFGIAIDGDDARYGRQASDAAFEELGRLERLLSKFIPTSDIGQINSGPPGRPVVVSAETAECLELAAQVWCDTRGAFDVTVGGIQAHTTAAVGMDYLQMDRRQRTACRRVDGLAVDLGGIGKGYALDRLAELLRGWGIHRALLDSGQSTVLAMGEGWTVALRDPFDQRSVLSQVVLCDCALAGSGAQLHGQHIIDPQTRRPASARAAAWAVAPSAAMADALSTAFMVMKRNEIDRYCSEQPGTRALLWDEPGRFVAVGPSLAGCRFEMGSDADGER